MVQQKTQMLIDFLNYVQFFPFYCIYYIKNYDPPTKINPALLKVYNPCSVR